MTQGKTLHIATWGYHTDPDDLRGQPLAIASEFHIQFVPAPLQPGQSVERRRLITRLSPVVIRRGEFDFSER